MIGPCAKRRVRCTIVARDGRAVTGENECANAQDVCPRGPDEGYEKCHSVCRQVGHAEDVALDKARASDFDFEGAIAVLAGHDRICSACEQALDGAGITEVRFGVPDL